MTFDEWYESYPDTTPYMDGMRDAFNAGAAEAREIAAMRMGELTALREKLQCNERSFDEWWHSDAGMGEALEQFSIYELSTVAKLCKRAWMSACLFGDELNKLEQKLFPGKEE